MADISVELLNWMGNDLTVVNAARVSMAKESEWEYLCPCGATSPCYSGPCRMDQVLSDRDAKLIAYLAKHKHWTPFGHCAATFRIKAPIFVRSQLAKHTVGLVMNEVSRRYVDSPPEIYTPKTWRKRADSVKQGSSDETVVPSSWWVGDTELFAPEVLADICVNYYQHLLDEGVCPEQARMVLPQSMMTEWIWTGSLAAFSRVCALRLDPHAQAETREVAQAISNEMALLFPVSWKELQSNA